MSTLRETGLLAFGLVTRRCEANQMVLAAAIFYVSLLFVASPVANLPICGSSAASASCVDPTIPCCSQYGYCGNTSEFCSSGCQSNFGKCSLSNVSAASTTAQGPSSPFSRCGIDPSTNQNFGSCQEPGYCCSFFGYCGTDRDHCAACQPGYGYCPHQCDENSSFCGPADIAALILGILGTFTGAAALLVSLRQFRKQNNKADKDVVDGLSGRVKGIEGHFSHLGHPLPP